MPFTSAENVPKNNLPYSAQLELGTKAVSRHITLNLALLCPGLVTPKCNRMRLMVLLILFIVYIGPSICMTIFRVA